MNLVQSYRCCVSWSETTTSWYQRLCSCCRLKNQTPPLTLSLGNTSGEQTKEWCLLSSRCQGTTFSLGLLTHCFLKSNHPQLQWTTPPGGKLILLFSCQSGPKGVPRIPQDDTLSQIRVLPGNPLPWLPCEGVLIYRGFTLLWNRYWDFSTCIITATVFFASFIKEYVVFPQTQQKCHGSYICITRERLLLHAM